jgi:hypothetical protein
MAFQTTYSQDASAYLAGMRASGANSQIDAFVCEGTPVVGLLVQRGTDPERQVKPLAELALDVDSIVDASPGIASASTAQTITAASADGVIGGGRIVPAQQLTATLSSHTDWDATESVFTYEDVNGKVVTESVLIPNGGAATIKTKGAASRFISWYIPAQTSTGGTATIGTDPVNPELSLADFPGIAMLETGRHPYDSSNQFTDKDPINVGRIGDFAVVVEDTVVAGDHVYVRTTASGADVRGQFGGERSTSFGLLIGARYVKGASTDGIAVVRLG